MTLKDAVKEVIRQNKSIGFNPKIFIIITKNGEAENLDEVISKLVLKEELLEELEKAINKYGDVLTIEDVITRDLNHLNFSEEVIVQAKARSEWFDILRKNKK